MITASKKDKNRYDLKKKLKITVEQKLFQRGWLEMGKKQILGESQSNFPLKMHSYITKRAELSLQIRIVKLISFMISTKGQAVLVKLLQVSFNIEFTTILQTTYKYVILVKDKVICHLKKDA